LIEDSHFLFRRLAMNSEDHHITGNGSARERLLRAGAALFAERGYSSTSVREIVEQAGVTKPVLYYHFDNKEGLFRAMLEWASRIQDDVLNRAMATPGKALDRFILLYSDIYRGVMENRDLFKMIHNLLFGPPQGAPESDIKAYHRRMVQVIETIYTEGIPCEKTGQADAADAAILILSLIDSCIHLDHLYPESADPDRPERLLRLAFRGVDPKGKGSPQGAENP
jgi:AcrR family transcriptional regulator